MLAMNSWPDTNRTILRSSKPKYKLGYLHISQWPEKFHAVHARDVLVPGLLLPVPTVRPVATALPPASARL